MKKDIVQNQLFALFSHPQLFISLHSPVPRVHHWSISVISLKVKFKQKH